MPLTKKGKKIMRSMKEQYGDKKGERVFYATKNKGKIKGVDMEKKPVIKANNGMGEIIEAVVDEKRKQMGAMPRTGMEANKMQGATPMAGGGYVNRSKPIDGAAVKGKTKGRMC